MFDHIQLPPEVEAILAELKSRIRRYVLWEGLALAVVAVGLFFWFSLGFDYAVFSVRRLEPPRWLRVGLDLAVIGTVTAVLMAVKFALTAPQIRVQGDRIFTTSFYEGGQLVEVGAAGPRVVWKGTAKGERPAQTTDLSSIIATPLWQGDTIYGVDSYGELRGLEAATGKRLWSTMQATRGPLTPDAVKARETPSETAPWNERWSNAFLVENGDRTVLFNEQGVLIFAKLTPAGYEELDRAQILKPTNRLAGRPVVWMHPAFANGRVYARNDEKLVVVELKK